LANASVDDESVRFSLLAQPTTTNTVDIKNIPAKGARHTPE
jgi:hypothetical protein